MRHERHTLVNSLLCFQCTQYISYLAIDTNTAACVFLPSLSTMYKNRIIFAAWAVEQSSLLSQSHILCEGRYNHISFLPSRTILKKLWNFLVRDLFNIAAIFLFSGSLQSGWFILTVLLQSSLFFHHCFSSVCACFGSLLRFSEGGYNSTHLVCQTSFLHFLHFFAFLFSNIIVHFSIPFKAKRLRAIAIIFKCAYFFQKMRFTRRTSYWSYIMMVKKLLTHPRRTITARAKKHK